MRLLEKTLGLVGLTRNYAGSSSPLEQRLRNLSSLERREEAKAFLRTFYHETGQSDAAFQTRWAEVRLQMKRTDFYNHTSEELAFGARVAWRNHSRCIGRLFWETLEVFDCRSLTTPDAIADRMVQHMTDAVGDGRIRSIVSIFAPVVPRQGMPAYVESQQITQYAGYVEADGSILGDRQNIEATRIALSLGYQPPEPRTAFDMLPFMIRDTSDRRILYPLPTSAYKEVDIEHPAHPALASLQLKWYAVPCVSGMILTIGGIDYPCAPFNGFYMCTEIASRDLVDKVRYDLLPQIATAFGEKPDDRVSPLWRDRALTELNHAVLHSYKAAGVTMVDHHTASEQYMKFNQREQACGRHVAASWNWIVPPQASSSCDVFHLKMRDYAPVPNFYYTRTDDGKRLMPFYGDQYRNKARRKYDDAKRRLTYWVRHYRNV
jgi:nitric-oxide synthase, bacterial